MEAEVLAEEMVGELGPRAREGSRVRSSEGILLGEGVDTGGLRMQVCSEMRAEGSCGHLGIFVKLRICR